MQPTSIELTTQVNGNNSESGPASEPTNPSSPGGWTGEERIAWLCLCLLNLAPIWATRFFPAQNGPWFLLPAHMFREYRNPAFDYSENFVRNWHPIPHMLHDALVALTAWVLPVLIAEKIILSVYVVLFPVSVFYFLSVFVPGRRWLGFLSFLMVISYPFMRGYHDFTLSIPLYFITLTYWFSNRDRLTPVKIATLTTLAVLVYLSHLVVFALLAGSIGWLCLFEDGRWGRAFKAALTVTWAGWLLFFDYVLLNRNSSWIDRSDTSWNSVSTNIQEFVGQYLYSVSHTAAGLAAAALIWGVVWVGLKRRATPSAERPQLRSVLLQPLATLLYFFLVAYFIAPYKVIGWHKANMRLLPLIYIIALALLSRLLPPTNSRGWRLALIIPTVAALLGANAILISRIHEMNAALETYTSGIEHVEQNPRLLRILVENPSFGGIRPLTRAQEYYHLAKGGVNGGSLPALDTLSVMFYRHYPVADRFPDYDPEATDEDSIAVLQKYEYILVWGESERLNRQLDQSSFECIHERKPFRLFRKQSR